eukprot:564826-Lingulodinium_polyedra.AAC.1
MFGSRAVAAAKRRSERIVVQRLARAAKWCDSIHRAPSQRLANRALACSMRAPENWRARGLRERA